jgi:hypothetical protein
MDIKHGAKRAKDRVFGIKDSVVSGIGKGFDTVTGKMVIEKVTEFAQETDAVNTAIVTRIYQLLDRQKTLEHEIKDTQKRHGRTRVLLIVSLFLNASCVLAIISLFVSKK